MFVLRSESTVSLFFPTPGDSAFSSWTYRIEYSELDGTPETVRENAMEVTLMNLQPGTSYQFTITAEGPGGEKQNPYNFAFRTRIDDGKKRGCAYVKLSDSEI